MRRVVGEVGHCVAVLKVEEDGTVDQLTIMSPSQISPSGRWWPPECIDIGNRENIVKLKTFLDKHLNATEVTP